MLFLATAFRRTALASAAVWLRAGVVAASNSAIASNTTRDFSTQPHGHYGTLTDQDIAYFQSIIGHAGVITDTFALESHNRCGTSKHHQRSTCTHV